MPDQDRQRPPFESRAHIEVMAPSELTSPLIFASPHSGRDYPPELLRISRLDRQGLRQSEDSYVDLLFDTAPAAGAPLLRALFPPRLCGCEPRPQ